MRLLPWPQKTHQARTWCIHILRLGNFVTLEIKQDTVLDIYNRPRDFRSMFFRGFLLFSQKLQKIQKPAIPHLKGLIVDIYILEGQGHSTISDRPDPLNVKKKTFQEKWAWQVLETATPLSF